MYVYLSRALAAVWELITTGAIAVSQDFIFYTSSRVLNKRIVELCVGNHELYAERRKPDSVEVQQLKMQAKHDRDKIRAER